MMYVCALEGLAHARGRGAQLALFGFAVNLQHSAPSIDSVWVFIHRCIQQPIYSHRLPSAPLPMYHIQENVNQLEEFDETVKATPSLTEMRLIRIPKVKPKAGRSPPIPYWHIVRFLTFLESCSSQVTP